VRPTLSVIATLSVLSVLSVLAVSACGSQSREAAQRTTPRLPPAVAAALATRSDALASALRRGDACGARIQVHGLERQTRLAIAAGRVPPAYRARLVAATTRIAAQMPRCLSRPAPPPVAPPSPVERQHPAGGSEGKHGKPDRPKKHNHGNGHGDEQ
jgi:hypothetical protein